ncbi:MAG: hypothetical protein COB14_04345 [Alphaproteobacteria bacterium]|nr:MAG: hypothetical protein COB14_04345 [Alphaproteobacteria bacterium]
MTKTSNSGVDLIKSFEGLRLRAYLCPARIWTIGYGHTKSVTRGDEINQAKASSLLREDLKWAEGAVEKYISVPLTSNQHAALVSFTFNLGAGALKKSTLRKRLNAGNYKAAAKELLKWNKARNSKGRLVVLSGLTRRRIAEKKLFENSEVQLELPLAPSKVETKDTAKVNPWITLFKAIAALFTAHKK